MPRRGEQVTDRRICVLTGDIVRSSRLSRRELEALMRALAEGADMVRHWTSPASPPLERFRGDGWQLALNEPHWALRAGLILRATVRMVSRSADTRIGFGIGSGEFASDLAASSGSAFELSGEQLEQLSGPGRWSFAADGMPSARLDLTAALFTACEGWSSGWTSKQAEAVALLIRPEEPAIVDVAERLGVRAQTVQDHFAKAGGKALLQVLHQYENSAR